MKQGGPLSTEEKFYQDWARETLKNNINHSNKILQQMIHINTVFLGGSLVFVDEKLMSTSFQVILAIIFLVALIVNFLGAIPYENNVNINILDEIKNHKKTALSHKRRFIFLGGLITLMGMIMALVGVMEKVH